MVWGGFSAGKKVSERSEFFFPEEKTPHGATCVTVEAIPLRDIRLLKIAGFGAGSRSGGALLPEKELASLRHLFPAEEHHHSTPLGLSS